MNMRLFILLFTFILPCFAMAQTKLTGTIKDENGQTLGFATVKLIAGDEVIATAVADSLGNFSISTPDSKSYSLQITFAGNSVTIDDVNQEKLNALVVESGIEIETRRVKVKTRGNGSKN